MSDSHHLRCRCGALAGTLDGAAWTNRVICYCSSCQAFPSRLGCAEQTLGAQGGSDIVQTGPSYLTLHQGAEQLACLQLTAKGPLRWYARCCNTPIGNTPANPRLAFVGLLHDCLGEPAALDAAFGPPRMRVFTGSARGEPKPRGRMPPAAIAGFVLRMLGARLSGRYRQTPFFDDDGAPVAIPEQVWR